MAGGAFYVVVFERSDEETDAGPHETDEAGMEQLAKELQEAYDVSGALAGFFRVVARIRT